MTNLIKNKIEEFRERFCVGTNDPELFDNKFKDTIKPHHVSAWLQSALEEVERESFQRIDQLMDQMRSEKEYLNGNMNDIVIKRETLLDVKHRLKKLKEAK